MKRKAFIFLPARASEFSICLYAFKENSLDSAYRKSNCSIAFSSDISNDIVVAIAYTTYEYLISVLMWLLFLWKMFYKNVGRYCKARTHKMIYEVRTIPLFIENYLFRCFTKYRILKTQHMIHCLKNSKKPHHNTALSILFTKQKSICITKQLTSLVSTKLICLSKQYLPNVSENKKKFTNDFIIPKETKIYFSLKNSLSTSTVERNLSLGGGKVNLDKIHCTKRVIRNVKKHLFYKIVETISIFRNRIDCINKHKKECILNRDPCHWILQ